MPKTERKRPESVRSKRVPLHEQKNIQTITDQEAGYVYRLFYDEDSNRIERLMKAGWEVVEDVLKIGDDGAKNLNQSIGNGVRQQVSIDKRNGEPLYQILMRIKEEFYKEDFAYKQKKEDEKMEIVSQAIQTGTLAFTKE